MSDNLADEFGILREQKNNRIYGNAANQVFRSSIDDGAKLAIFSNSTKSKQPIG